MRRVFEERKICRGQLYNLRLAGLFPYQTMRGHQITGIERMMIGVSMDSEQILIDLPQKFQGTSML